MTFGQRFLLTLAIVIFLLVALAAVGFFVREDEEPATVFGLASAETRPELCMDDETRERVRKLMLEALDTAFRERIEKLYEVWLSDATDQPRRAAKGADAAMRAYYHARGAAMKFSPPECSG